MIDTVLDWDWITTIYGIVVLVVIMNFFLYRNNHIFFIDFSSLELIMMDLLPYLEDTHSEINQISFDQFHTLLNGPPWRSFHSLHDQQDFDNFGKICSESIQSKMHKLPTFLGYQKSPPWYPTWSFIQLFDPIERVLSVSLV